MRIRLDELDRLIAVVEKNKPSSQQPRSSGSRLRRRRKPTLGEIIDRPILEVLLQKAVTTAEMVKLLPSGSRVGPTISAWKRRAAAADVVFDDLVQRSTNAAGEKVYALTPEGKRVFSGALSQPVPQEPLFS